jgi:hypothetical protein
MAIVYYLDYPCPVKEEVAPGRMLRLLYAHERANAALNRARRDQPDISPEHALVTLSIKRGDNKRGLETTTVANVQRQFQQLEDLSHHCRGCRASVDGRTFGCRGRIEFPVSLRTETLLMSRIHAGGGDPTAGMLANYFENNGITGNRAAEMRKHSGVFFENRKALTRRLPDGRKISANQVFELFLQPPGPISSRHARFLLGMFDLLDADLPLDRPLDSLRNLFVVEHEDAGIVVSRVGLKLFEGHSERSTHQLENYLGALLLASELGHELWIKG